MQYILQLFLVIKKNNVIQIKNIYLAKTVQFFFGKTSNLALET